MVTIPNLPTDSYYKFKALAYLFITCFCLGAEILLFISVKDDLSKLEYDSELLNGEMKILEYKDYKLEQKTKTLQQEISKRNKTVQDSSDSYQLFKAHRNDLYKDKNYREYFEFIFKYSSELFPTESLKNDLKKNLNEQEKLLDEIQRKNSAHSASLAVLKSNKMELLFASIFLLIFFVIGWGLTFKAFAEWYEKGQKPLDEKLHYELKKMKRDSELGYNTYRRKNN